VIASYSYPKTISCHLDAEQYDQQSLRQQLGRGIHGQRTMDDSLKILPWLSATYIHNPAEPKIFYHHIYVV